MKMADNNKKKIPVFTVLKNGAVLKNIFVVNDPPSPLSQSIAPLHDHKEEVLLVGRHPHCNIVLTHPSISRFHLQIFSYPSAHKIFVMDLSSVHGTWVSERKIEPGVRVELSEGDTVRLGGSSRVYQLHWIPLDHAYDLENSFLSELNASLSEEKEEEEEDKVIQEELEVEEYQEEQPVETECKDAQNLEDFFTPDNNGRQENLCFEESRTEEVNTSDVLVSDIEPLAFSETSPMLGLLEENMYLSACITEQKKSSDIVVDSIGSILCKEYSPVLKDIKSSVYPEENSGLGIDLESPLQAPSETDVKAYDQEKHSCLDIVVDSIGSITCKEYSPVLKDMKSPVFPEETSGLGIDLESPIQAPFETDVKAYDQEKHSCHDILVDGIGTMSSIYPEENSGLGIDLESSHQAPSETCVKAYDQEKHSSPDISADSSGGNESSMVILEHDYPEGYSAAATSEENDSCLENENNPRDDLKHCSMPFHSILAQDQLSLPESLSEIKSQHAKEVKADNSTVQKSLSTVYGDPYDYEGNSSEDKTLCMDGQEERDDLSVHQVTQSVGSFMPFQEILCDQKLNIEKRTSPVFDEENENNPIARCGTKSNLPSIWSRRGKPATDLQLKTGKSRGKPRSSTLDNKNQINKENSEIIPRTLFNGLEGAEEEIYTPDKENLTPKALKDAIKIGLQHSKSLRKSISKPSSILADCTEDEIYHSPNKENHTPRVLGGHKKMTHMSGNRSCLQEVSRIKRHVERLPFKSLHASPGSQSKSTDVSTREKFSVNCVKLNENQSGFSANVFSSQANRNWIMVVDTSSFLRKESWKSLQLLQGLKGTQLIIPRIVIRELNCMRQSFSLFRRTAKVSSILEWIEESMLNAKWWVHVQNFMEEGISVAPTPPATPHYRLDDGSEDFPIITSNSARISSFGSVHTPTTEDHVLECALIFKKLKSNGKLVLLSNDVSLKINAMAEGILCETAEEFRESLVNPLSDRFMWVDSSPRGQSWSFATDIPEEKNSRSPWKKSSRGHGARGLKLIMLHNSHYGKSTSFA